MDERYLISAEAETLQRLARDIERIVRGEAPSASDLDVAPILDGWAAVQMAIPALVGSVSGHPRLGDRPFIRTTPLFALDRHGTWARSMSRFYRLGRRMNEPKADHA